MAATPIHVLLILRRKGEARALKYLRARDPWTVPRPDVPTSNEPNNMLDQILSTLQQQAGPELISKLGLNKDQAEGSVNAAASSITQVLGGADGFGLDDVMNLFSADKNTAGADGILNNIGSVLQGKLTGEVGLDALKAGGVKDMLLPMITSLVGKYIGGDNKNLQSLIGSLAGGQGGGVADLAKGMLGKLFS